MGDIVADPRFSSHYRPVAELPSVWESAMVVYERGPMP
jgi:hypothetical protein